MTVHNHVYLAGPILGCTVGEAQDWRREVCKKLTPHNIVGISPLRCEPLHGDRYSPDYPDPCFGIPRAIAAKNRYDVITCALGIYFIPKPEKDIEHFEEIAQTDLATGETIKWRYVMPHLHSFGTIGELFWANGAGKQTILVTNDPFIMKHPVIDAASNWKLQTLDEACDVVIGVLGGYCGGKNI